MLQKRKSSGPDQIGSTKYALKKRLIRVSGLQLPDPFRFKFDLVSMFDFSRFVSEFGLGSSIWMAGHLVRSIFVMQDLSKCNLEPSAIMCFADYLNMHPNSMAVIFLL